MIRSATASPPTTPSAPPSVKSFWTSTMNSALLMIRGYAGTPRASVDGILGDQFGGHFVRVRSLDDRRLGIGRRLVPLRSLNA